MGFLMGVSHGGFFLFSVGVSFFFLFSAVVSFCGESLGLVGGSRGGFLWGFLVGLSFCAADKPSIMGRVWDFGFGRDPNFLV